MVHEEDRALRTGERLLDAPDRGKYPGLRRERGDERIVDPHVGTEVGKLLDDRDRGRLPGVADVLLVGEGHDGDLRPVEALAGLPEAALGEVDDVHLHELIDIAGGFDEAVWTRGGMGGRIASRRIHAYSGIHDVSPGT